MNIKLVKLTPEYRPQLEEMMGEWLSREQDFSPYAIRKNDYHDFEHYLAHLECTGEEPGLVPDSVFFCLDLDRNIFVGAVNIRHYLNDYLLQYGGHIGDGIRPSQRRKGYATAMIRLALEECRKLGIERVLMTCDKDNIGSAKSIRNNGGVLENELMDEDGVWEQRYWIDLAQIPKLTTVYLVRHCQSEFSHRDDRTRPLTAQGMADAAEVARVLRDVPIDAFYCSPYRRSLDTITLAAQEHGLPIRTDERLRRGRQCRFQGRGKYAPASALAGFFLVRAGGRDAGSDSEKECGSPGGTFGRQSREDPGGWHPRHGAEYHPEFLPSGLRL